MTNGALSHLRILDLSRVLAGPVCTQILGDLGADIIKIERPGEGDDTRKWGPPFLKDAHGNDTQESAYYLSANRNKRSVAIDITKTEGQDLIHKLLEQSDVLIQNFKTGGLEKYGLGYDDIKARHPHIVYCAITGFGHTGPMAEEPGYDLMAQAMGGLMAITGVADGEPMKVGVAVVDVMTGLYAAIGILAALQSREKTGKGQFVDLALLDCTIASLTNIAQYYLTSGTLAPRQGNAHSTIVPYQAFETKDGHIIVAIGNDSQFARFATFLKQDWHTDPRFITNQNRLHNRALLVPEIQALLKNYTTDDLYKALQDIDVPGGPVNAMDQVFAMDQVKERAMNITVDNIKLVGSPLKLSDTPVSYRHAPPSLGQHTNDVLEEVVNLAPADIDRLRKTGIIS